MVFKQEGIKKEWLETTPVPVLFLTGEQDYNSTAQMSQKLANIPPQADFAVIVEAKHMVQLSHPKDTHDAIDRFLKKVQTS